MKWWHASTAALLWLIVFAALAVGWHRYIATGLPLAAPMRHVYLDTNRFGYLMFYGFPDTLFPIAFLGVGLGVIGRRQRLLPALIQASWVSLAAVALMPLYTHWLHPVPRPKDWPLYPSGWALLLKPDALFSIVGIELAAISVRRGSGVAPGAAKKGNIQGKTDRPVADRRLAGRPPPGDYKSDALRVVQIMHERNCGTREALALVEAERAARRQREGEDMRPSGMSIGDELQDASGGRGNDWVKNGPPTYTPHQIDGIILLMCGRGWTVEQAALNFQIPPDELRERWRRRSHGDFAPPPLGLTRRVELLF